MSSTAIRQPRKSDIIELRRRLAEPAGKTRPKVHEIALSDRDYRLLRKILNDLANGKLVSLTDASPEITTQQAASLLGVSRQFLVRLLDEGKIPFHRAGTHRRVYLSDLTSFRNDRDRRRHSAISQMAQQAVKDGLYDEF
jgi:excisionase family DNA binding protein